MPTAACPVRLMTFPHLSLEDASAVPECAGITADFQCSSFNAERGECHPSPSEAAARLHEAASEGGKPRTARAAGS